jgi:hypothetical protein
MPIQQPIIDFVLRALRIAAVGGTIILCVAALIKAFAALFIDLLPMDAFTHQIFSWLQRAVLIVFGILFIRYIVEEELHIPIRKVLESVWNFFKSRKQD